MSSAILSEFKRFFETEGVPVFDSFDYQDLIGLGIMDSSQYRAIFLNLTKNRGFKMETYVMIYILVNQVKSLSRLTDSRGMKSEKFMTNNDSTDWYGRIMEFLEGDCVQYVSQISPGTPGEGKFPLVNINTCWPTMAFFAFCYIIHGKFDVTVLTDDEILEELLAPKNTWVVQMHNDLPMQERAKSANVKFWEDTVKSSRNPIQSKFEGNTGTGKGKWNADYYNTQMSDNYPYAMIKAGKFSTAPGMKQQSDIVSIIRNFFPSVKGKSAAKSGTA